MDYRLETFQNWCSDFCGTDSALSLSRVTLEYASEILPFFLSEALSETEVNASEFELQRVTLAFQSIGSKFDLPQSVSDEFPHLCGDFIDYLSTSGRVSGGESISDLVREMKLSTKAATIKRPGSKLNRNDPCPCGSGKKYKKCCMNLLG
jgi:hypothetical protein